MTDPGADATASVGRGRNAGTTVIALAAIALLAVGADGALLVAGPRGNPCPTIDQPTVTASPIQHLFILVKENHAFENYFGTLPGVVGYPPNGSFPLAFGSNATVAPFPLPGDATPDLPHYRSAELVDQHAGANDLFVAEAAALGAPEPQDAVGYYTRDQIPQYFAYAASYALSDGFFSGVLGPTVPNRLYDLAGTDAGVTTDDIPPAGSLHVPTVLDQLTAARIPWQYAYTGTPTWLAPLEFSGTVGDACATASIVPTTRLAAELVDGQAPAVVFIDPAPTVSVSEHPPGSVAVGADWTAAVVNAIFSSALGPSSALLLFYDEAGGFWDPVPAPMIGTDGAGFRVPFLVLSPFTHGGHVVHQTMDPTAVLAFIDRNWGLPPLTPEVAAAPTLDPFFEFGTPPRPPLLLPTNASFTTIVTTLPRAPPGAVGAGSPPVAAVGPRPAGAPPFIGPEASPRPCRIRSRSSGGKRWPSCGSIAPSDATRSTYRHSVACAKRSSRSPSTRRCAPSSSQEPGTRSAPAAMSPRWTTTGPVANCPGCSTS